jgi:putative ABC transport system substrate-binding protein
MERRTFLAMASGGLLALPLAAEAQQPGKQFRIGILSYLPATDPVGSRFREAVLAGLRDLGYIEGQHFTIEWRSWEGSHERLRALATELAQLRVDVVIVGPTPAAEEMKRASSTIPIVAVHGDPVGSGLVASLARPGANVTGISILNTELIGKQLQMLKEVSPKLSRVAVLSNPTTSTHQTYLRQAEASARSLDVRLVVLKAHAPNEFAGAFSTATRERAGALIVLGDTMFYVERTQIAGLAVRHRLPSIAPQQDQAAAGYLMAYGVSAPDTYRRATVYVDKILRGAKPADLPFEQATKFDLVVNLKTAKALGLTIPPALLARADQVLE